MTLGNHNASQQYENFILSIKSARRGKAKTGDRRDTGRTTKQILLVILIPRAVPLRRRGTNQSVVVNLIECADHGAKSVLPLSLFSFFQFMLARSER